MEEKALALSEKRETQVSVRLGSLDDVAELAQIIIDAGWVKPGTKQTDVMLRVLKGQEVGIPAIEASNTISVINGKPSIYGDGQLAVVRKSGLLEDIDEHFEKAEDGTTVAVCTVKRRGQKTPHTTRYGYADAKRARLAGKPGPWTDNPARMCQMRARAFNLRDMFPDVLCGLWAGEEAEDIDQDAISVPAESAPLPPPAPRRAQRKAATPKDPEPPVTAQFTPPAGEPIEAEYEPVVDTATGEIMDDESREPQPEGATTSEDDEDMVI